MPDIAAARPASGTPIESTWGGQVHDLVEGVQGGTVGVSLANQVFANLAVTFPRPYASTPVVVVCVGPQSSGAGTGLFAQSDSVTPTGFTMRMVNRDNASLTVGPITCSWIAVGTPA